MKPLKASVFNSVGYVCPEDFNPADYLIQTLALTPGAEGSSRRVVRHICDQFAVSDYARELEMQINFQQQMGTAFDVSGCVNVKSRL